MLSPRGSQARSASLCGFWRSSGPLELERPRIRLVSEPEFENQVLGKGVARTHALEALIIVGFLPGLSVRDIETLLGTPSASRSSASRPPRGSAATRRSATVAQAPARRARPRPPATSTRSSSSCAPDHEPAEAVLVVWGHHARRPEGAARPAPVAAGPAARHAVAPARAGCLNNRGYPLYYPTSAGSSGPWRRSRPRRMAAMNLERLTSSVSRISSA